MTTPDAVAVRVLALSPTPPAQTSNVALGLFLPRPTVTSTTATSISSGALTAELVNENDLTTVLATFDLASAAHPAWEWYDPASDYGSGQLGFRTNDTDMAAFADDGTDVIRFYYRGVPAFLLLCEGYDETVASERGYAELVRTYQGRGGFALLDRGIIDPTGGPYRSPVEEDRHWGWPVQSFDHSTWTPAAVLGTLEDVIVFEATQSGLDVERIKESYLSSVGTLAVPILGPTGADLVTEQPEDIWYVYEDETTNAGLNIAAAGEYNLTVLVDDEIQWWVDGQNVTTVTGVNQLAVQTITVTLSAGAHSIAAAVRNSCPECGPYDVTKYGWVITQEFDTINTWPVTFSTAEIEDNPPTIIAMSNGNAKTLPYPGSPPGQTITKTIRLALEETQARGYLPWLGLDFTDTSFTDGTQALAIPDYACKVGIGFGQFVLEMCSTYIDVRLDVVTGKLQVWEKGNGGHANTASFHVAASPADATTGNLKTLTHRADLKRFDRLLLRWQGGWAERISGGSGDEVTLELGSAFSVEELYRLADGELATFGAVRTEIEATIRPTIDADRPYVPGGFRVMDTVLCNGDSEPVIAIAVRKRDEAANEPEIVVSLRDPVLTLEERQARDIRNLL